MNVVRWVVRVEVGYALLLLSVFVLPEWTNDGRVPALVLATGLAAGHALLDRRRALVPVAILVYIGVYGLAVLHSDREFFRAIDAAQILALPVFALAVAWAAQEAAIRRRIVWLTVGAVALQIPVVLYQVIDLHLAVSWNVVVNGADSITGLLGDSQASTLGQVGLLAALLMLCAGCVGSIPFRWGLGSASALILLTVLSSTRASYLFAVATLACIAAGLWLAKPAPVSNRARSVAVMALVIAPLLFLATDAVYPGANGALVSWSGFVATIEEGDQQLDDGTGGGGGEAEEELKKILPGADSTRLPGRQQQLANAAELSFGGSVGDAVLGRGIGVTALENPSDPIVRPEQGTSGVWLARILVETGFVGALAFVLLNAYLVWLWWRNRPTLRTAEWDAALICALPGIIALTAAGALYNAVLVVRPFATLFWALLGVLIALDASHRGAAADTDHRLNAAATPSASGEADPRPELREPAEPARP